MPEYGEFEQPAKPVGALGEPFVKMAQAIDRNHGLFGGAFVVVPPEGGGPSMEVLILDPHGDATLFWSSLKTKCEMALADVEAAQREQSAGFPSYRR